jgi:hypothetical protein
VVPNLFGGGTGLHLLIDAVGYFAPNSIPNGQTSVEKSK